MLRQVKPRNARSKRALEKREPKAVENPKQCLFLRGTSCSQITQDALTDLHSLRLPLAKKFTKKNPIHPFEDASSLEFFSEKNDASLLVFGSSQKKRPHTLTLIRTFGYKVLDMLELYLDPETFRTMAQFKNKKFAVGLRPMLLFAGTAFESPVSNEYTLAKSLLLDFFKGDPSDKIDVEGLQYIVSVTAEDATGDGDAKPAIHLRSYMIQTKRSGQKLPRVEVEEIGPRMDLRVGRVKEADESMLKEAMKKARGLEERTKKNITTNSMGDKIGRVHLGKQDLSQLQLRKMKGLKRSRNDEELVEDVIADDDTKRIKQ
ncbi:rRNA-binding ribosome biosynthesis protein rpf2 [Metarhizium acridum]|uniref:Ribosome production factor 2 homolog n=1 Tax=Metarhizium acridum (strain CQMa 102) TaxID=655827 RepID=E9E2V6_METAQ|nr:Brix domain-containing protein-like protein [Metarhizium acridum CQMa 102]EFY89772.1 Brix domain-containing protein-like protein [Metarhizium acridum CQMa 102]KAG8421583.1 rRNA-binding ribosome biosynthesis protein rpf2 [Metarhizium acridum]